MTITWAWHVISAVPNYVWQGTCELWHITCDTYITYDNYLGVACDLSSAKLCMTGCELWHITCDTYITYDRIPGRGMWSQQCQIMCDRYELWHITCDTYMTYDSYLGVTSDLSSAPHRRLHFSTGFHTSDVRRVCRRKTLKMTTQWFIQGVFCDWCPH